MSIIEGVTAQLKQLTDELTQLSGRVASLEESLAGLKVQTATGGRSVAQSTPAAPTSTTKSTAK